jgi:hypothetical protein
VNTIIVQVDAGARIYDVSFCGSTLWMFVIFFENAATIALSSDIVEFNELC